MTWSGRMMPSFMVRKRSSSSGGRPSSVRKTWEGKGIGELLGEVHLTPVDEAVDEVVDERGDLVVHGRHLAGGEDRVEELAELLVLRRVDLQRDHRPLVLEVDRVHVGGEDLGVAQGLVDVRLARQQRPPARRQSVDGHDRHVVAQHLADGLRVGGHLGAHALHRVRAGVAVLVCGTVRRRSPRSLPSRYSDLI